MSQQVLEGFSFVDWRGPEREAGADEYARIVDWAAGARRRNPDAFDVVIQWLRDDSRWTEDKLAENQQIIMDGLIARFREQNVQLRQRLRALESSAAVNPAVFETLDRFDRELSGETADPSLQDTVSLVFTDFSVMQDRGVRETFAGNKTGPAGVDSVDAYGYMNYLKECDASVQWALFMPDLVQHQQDGFEVASFEHMTMPAMRFLGRDSSDVADHEALASLFHTLDAMPQHASGFDHDLLLAHHYGLGVDVGPCHEVWGRFMKAGAPVPEGFLALDFLPECGENAGPPYCPQFAFATFSGDSEAMHRREGYDVGAMYDVTRNIVLGQDVPIPYPDKYWSAEVFLEGADKPSSAFLFGVIGQN